MKLLKPLGATSEIWQLFIQDAGSTTGAGLAGLTNASAGLSAYYHRDTDTTATVMSLVTMTVGTFTSLGFKEIDATHMPGWYQFCPPNAALASGAKSCAFHLQGAASMAPLPIEVQLTAVNPDSPGFGLVNASANVAQWNGTNVATPATAGIPDVNVKNLAGSVSVGAAGYVGVDWAQLANKTTTNALTGTTISASQVVASVTAGVTLAASAIQAVWDAATSAFTTAGSIGKRLVDNLDAAVSSRMATYTQPSGFLAAAFPTTVASPTNITAGTVTTVSGNVNGNVTGAVGSVTGNVNGSVGSVAAGGITAASLASGAITAAKIATDAIGAAQLAADAIDELWDEAVDGTVTARQSLRLANSANGGILAGAATASVTVRDLADTKTRITATVDASGNRTAVTRDLT